MIPLGVVVVGSYLVGSIPFSYLAGKWVGGIDLREHGSGNLGATNTFRMLGGKVAVWVLAADIAKGFFPAFLAARLPLGGGVPAHWLALAAGFGAIMGHLFSIYLKLVGGKGIATSAGAFIALSPWSVLGAFIVWGVLFATTRIVSLGSLGAAVTLPLFVFIVDRTGLASSHWSLLLVSCIITVVVVVKHRSNIQRLVAGKEPALARRKK